MSIKINSNEQFKQDITSGVSLVDFYADWCGPCKMLSPIIEEISHDLQGRAKVFKVDVDQFGALAQSYEITSVPTLLLFKDGQIKERIIGYQPKVNILKKVEKFL